MKIQDISNPYDKNLLFPGKNRVFCNADISCSDTVSFKAKTPELYRRMDGWCNFFYDKSGLKKEITEKIPLFKNKKFTFDMYKKLSDEEKNYLRTQIKKPYLKDEYLIIEAKRTIENDAKFFVKLSKRLKNIMDKQYPQGWTLVSIGASPAIFAQILKHLGADAKIVPFSKRLKRDPAFDSINFDKYFNEVGLTKDSFKEKKQMIYTDFVSGGETIRMFENLIKSTGRYRKEDRFEDFSSLFGLNLNVHEEELLNEFFFNKSQIKSYSACPYMNSAIRCENILQLDKQFNWNFASKLMNFAFMDNIETAKNSLPARILPSRILQFLPDLLVNH